MDADITFGEEEPDYMAEFNAAERTVRGRITSVDKQIQAITFEINDLIKEVERHVDVDSYFEALERIPNLKYKSPVGLFLGWLCINYEDIKREIDWIMEYLPGTVDPITRLELVRYLEFWSPS